MEKENKKKGQVMNIINKLSVVISVYNEEAVFGQDVPGRCASSRKSAV